MDEKKQETIDDLIAQIHELEESEAVQIAIREDTLRKGLEIRKNLLLGLYNRGQKLMRSGITNEYMTRIMTGDFSEV